MKAVNHFSTLHTMQIFFSVILFSTLLTGCVREDTPEVDTAGHVFNISYSFDDPQTRVIATGSERQIKDVAIFFYNANDDPEQETYVDCQAVKMSPGSSSPGSFPLPLPGTILPGSKYRLIVIGNYKEYAPEGLSLEEYASLYNTRTYSQMKQKIQGQLPAKGARVVAPLPFWGRLLGADSNETTLTGPTPTEQLSGVSVRFSRAVARFDVTNLAAARLRIAWVKVCNYPEKGYFYHESLPEQKDIVRGTSDTPAGPPYPPGYVIPSDLPDSPHQNLNKGGLYAFPNTVTYTAQDDKLTTCLIIAGYYQDPKAGTPNNDRLTYYRANVSENGESQVLRRNYVYTIVINSVNKAGAETEEGAMNEKEKVLDCVVDDKWDSDEGNIETDDAGNFLALSRTSVVLGSAKDETALVKVSVKKGAGWTAVWENNADNAFRLEKVGSNSFSITTNGENTSLFTPNAALKVALTGITPELSLTVNVTQLSSVSDPRLLMVEGKAGSFDYAVPGQGGEASLQVITGSPTSRWKAEADPGLQAMLVPDSYTAPLTGANKGFAGLSFSANTGITERSGTLTVSRLLPDGTSVDTEIAPVSVVFKQGKSPYVVSLFPNYSEGGLTVNAFSSAAGNANGVIRNVRFSVLLADPGSYKFEATCSFNKNSDAFLTLTDANTAKTAGPLQTSKSAPSTVNGTGGNSIWLNVFRTGPGDKPINGDITVKAVPKDPASGLPTATYSVNITIKSGCGIADSKIGNLLWADRNVGADSRIGDMNPGLNYSNDVNSDDNKNGGFKGGYYNFAAAPGKCGSFGANNNYEGELATGWRVPSSAEQSTVASRMRFSKQRAFIVSDDKTKGTVGCWFPISGEATNPTSHVGRYWSSTPRPDPSYAVFLDIGLNSAISNNNKKSVEYSMRCVR